MGFSLIELMLSITLSSVLLTCLMTLFLTAIKNIELESTFARMENNALVIQNIFNQNIEAAGYIGCAKYNNDFPLANHTEIIFNPISKTPDSLTTRYGNFTGASLIKPMASDSILYVKNIFPIHEGDTFLISDCKRADIFQVESITKNDDMIKIKSSSPLSNHYDTDATLRELVVKQFYIDATHSSLYEKTLKKRSELVENVTNLKVQFNKHQDEIKGVNIEITQTFPTIKKTRYFYVALKN